MPDYGKVALSQIDVLSGVNSFSTFPTFENGRLKKVENKNGSSVVSSASFTFNIDGSLKDITETINGKTVKTTLNYINGVFVSTKKEVL